MNPLVTTVGVWEWEEGPCVKGAGRGVPARAGRMGPCSMITDAVFLDGLTGMDMSTPTKPSGEKYFSAKSELGEIFLAEGG